MKSLFASLFMALISCVFVNAQTTLRTETTFQNDALAQGVSVQRFQLNSSVLNIKYDYKVDLVNHAKTVNDVLSILSPKIMFNDISLTPGIIKLGDWDSKKDELLLDLTIEKSFRTVKLSVELGHGMKNKYLPRDFFVTRLANDFFTVEASAMSTYGHSNFNELTKNRYYWGAIHPRFAYVAVGSELSRSWFLAGTQGMKDFANFSFINIDRNNKNFWFRSQTGVGNVNQKFYCTSNYVTATSYVIVPPFHYMHFSPIATKGDYAFKVDGKRTGDVEIWEAVVAKNLNDFGRITLGWQKESSNKGTVAEYYKEILLGKFTLISELRYESIFSRFSGFITANYEF